MMLDNGVHAFCLDLAAKHILKVEIRKAVLSYYKAENNMVSYDIQAYLVLNIM